MLPVPTRKRWPRKLRKGMALAALLASCEPALVVGDLVCPPSTGGAPGFDANGVFRGCEPPSAGGGGSSAGVAGMAGMSGEMSVGGEAGEVCPEGGEPGFYDGPLVAPWKTSFDAGFCNYQDAGYCYADPESSRRVVTSPVHSGTFAAAFDMSPSSSTNERQTRCVRQGVLPVEAYYGAWYYIPSDLAGSHDWNLFHFAGGKPRSLLHGLWDVSMNDSAGNGLAIFIYDTVKDGHYGQTDPVPIPRDRWFQLEFYLKRAADATGEVAVYQDGVELVRRTGIVTDDTPFGEWYVGNYAGALDNTRSTVTVYVDDVTVRLP